MNEELNVKKNNKNVVLVVIIILLGIAVLLLADYICYDKGVFFNKESESNNQNTTKVEEKTTAFTMLTKNEKFELYIATDKYFEDGEKKLITSSNDIYDVEVYEGKVYYIDSSNSLKIYDIDTEKTEQYEIANITPHYNTKILPGNKYTIISQINKYELIDLESKTNKIIDTNNAMGYGVFDSNNNILYYSDSNKIYGMDILSNKKTEINVSKASARYIDNNKLYIEGKEDEYNEVFYIYDIKNKKLEKLNIKDTNTVVSAISNIYNIDDTVYITMNNNDKLIKYENGKESYIMEKDSIDFYLIGDKLYIATAPLECNELCGPGKHDKYYIYDTKTKELNETNNEYIKQLLDKYKILNILNIK